VGLKGGEYAGGIQEAGGEVEVLAMLMVQNMDANDALDHAVGFLESHDANVRSDVLLQAAHAIRQAADEGQITYVRDVEDILRIWAREESQS
jgi:hypothetical protein